MVTAFASRALRTIAAALCALASPGARRRGEIARGKYLVSIAGCSDCHTPGGMLGSPDMKRYLGGSDVGFSIPSQGVFVGSNLTPDNETGLGKWTAGADRHRDPQRQAAGRERTQRRDALRFLFRGSPTTTPTPSRPFCKACRRSGTRCVSYKSSDTVPIAVSAVLPPKVYNALPASQK